MHCAEVRLKRVTSSEEYSFRVRFTMSPRSRLQVEETSWTVDLSPAGGHVLVGSLEEKPIRESKELVIRAGGYPSEESATIAGRLHMDALMLAFTRLRIGADFGQRKGKSGYTAFGLEMIENQVGSRALNDAHGVLAFKSDPPPVFASVGPPTLVSIMQAERFAKAFGAALESHPVLSDSERLSLDLFHSSFFQMSNDTRFLALVMAVEALLHPQPRPPAVAAYLDRWFKEIEESDSISSDDKISLLGSLKWLYDESINRTGRKLAAQRLGDRRYLDRSAPTFFSYCYSLRSKLVHGESPWPTTQEVGRAAAQLEVFVSDLLSAPLVEVEF